MGRNRLLILAVGVMSLIATARSPALARPSAPPTAHLRYFLNSGWLVETEHYALVFDYVDAIDAARLPVSSSFDPTTIGGRHLIVFVSHGHSDHYAPVIFDWAGARPDTQYVFGWAPPARKERIHVMNARESWRVGDVSVKTTGSTDEGVGFMVSVDGVTLFHAGDLAAWSDAERPAFDSEIAWLRSQTAALDLAFFPVATGSACDPRPAIWEGVESAAMALAPRVLVPMHVRCADRLDIYRRFAEEVAPRLPHTTVVPATAVGEEFLYRHGTLSPARP